MITARFPRLETLFDVPQLDQLTVEHLKKLVGARIREREDLEFKQSLYGKTKSDARDLAVDVAAMANTQGGLIIIGIQDHNDVAVGLNAVRLGQETVRMKAIIADNTGPLPKVEIKAIDEPLKPAVGYYLIAVPKSTRAPHAVLVNEDLRYPRRDGPRNRYMSESEVAEAYRNWFREAEARVDRVQEVYDDGVKGLSSSGQLFLVMALAPAQPGEMKITSASEGDFFDWLNNRKRQYLGRSASAGHRPSIGWRRIIVSDFKGAGDEPPTWRYDEFHADGSGFGSDNVRIPREAAPHGFAETGLARLIGIGHDILTDLVDHAQQHCLVGGDGLMMGNLLIPESTGEKIKIIRAGWGIEDLTTKPLGKLRPSRHMINIDGLASSGEERKAVVRTMLTDVVQQLGIPEIQHITPEGALRLSAWDAQEHHLLRHWGSTGERSYRGTTEHGWPSVSSHRELGLNLAWVFEYAAP